MEWSAFAQATHGSSGSDEGGDRPRPTHLRRVHGERERRHGHHAAGSRAAVRALHAAAAAGLGRYGRDFPRQAGRARRLLEGRRHQAHPRPLQRGRRPRPDVLRRGQAPGAAVGSAHRADLRHGGDRRSPLHRHGVRPRRQLAKAPRARGRRGQEDPPRARRRPRRAGGARAVVRAQRQGQPRRAPQRRAPRHQPAEHHRQL
jgi:hypothetical protein